MMKLATRLLAATAASAMLVLVAPAAHAEQLMDSYTARLSPQDHVNSRGVPLPSAAMIIRQDRANVHRFGRRDPEDTLDTVFIDGGSREQMELYIASIERTAPASVRDAIINGTPLIRVDIYESYLDVTIISN